MLRTKRYSINVISTALALAGAFATSLPAHALTYQEAAKKGAATLGEITPISRYLSKVGGNTLKGLKITNIQVVGEALTANTTIKNKKWSVMVYKGKKAETSLIAFEPKEVIKVGGFFKKVPGINILEMMKATNQTLVLTAADVNLGRKSLPKLVGDYFSKYYPDRSDYTLSLKKGLTKVETVNLQKSGLLNDAVKFLGGKSTVIQVQTTMDGKVMEVILGNKLAEPKLTVTGLLPSFRPKIGGLIKMPANVQFALVGSLSKSGATVGYEGVTDFKIGKQKVNVVLASMITQPPVGVPALKVTATTFKGVPWKSAFGLKWMTIEDYTMEFKAKSSGTLGVGFGGKTTIGEKKVDMFASAQIGSESAGFPIPERIRLEINDGPNKIGVLSLRDMASVYNEMLKAMMIPAQLPAKLIPDVSIAGLRKGEGPKIDLIIAANSNAGFDMSGALIVLGKDIATIEKASLKSTEGLEIKASTKQLKAGPLSFPKMAVQVDFRYDPKTKSVPMPKVVFQGEDSFFLGKKTVDLAMALNQFEMRTTQDFGDALKFKFMATTGKAITNFNQIANADFHLNSSLSSDPAKWINTSGKNAVKDAAREMKKAFNVATAALNSAKKEVSKLEKEINKQRRIVKGERQDAGKALLRAREEVAKLNRTIASLDKRITEKFYTINHRRCNQSIDLGLFDAPNYPARAICEVENGATYAEIAWAKTEKTAVMSAKYIAQETVHLTQRGVEGLPVDVDPRVSGIIAAKALANAGLDVAKLSVKGVSELTKIIDKEVKKINLPNIFSLEQSSIQGSMQKAIKGKPVVLDMNFKLAGKPFGQSFGFSMTDMGFNAKQLEVIVLKVFVDGIVAAGKAAKIIPHALLGEVEQVYLRKQAEVLKVLQLAMTDNKIPSLAAGKRMGENIEKSNLARNKTLASQRDAAYKTYQASVDNMNKNNKALMEKARDKWYNTVISKGSFIIEGGANCLDAFTSSQAFGLYKCANVGHPNQTFELLGSGLTRNVATGKCISSVNGDQLTMKKCDWKDMHQRWKYEESKKRFKLIGSDQQMNRTNPYLAKCLSLKYNARYKLAFATKVRCDAKDNNQIWHITR